MEPEPRTDAPLHARNPTGRFSDRAADYKRFRPGYPERAVEMVLGGLIVQRRGLDGLSSVDGRPPPGPLPDGGGAGGAVAADIGAGTGIFSGLLADRGVSVLAVEPNEAMINEAGPCLGVRWVHAAAEATGLEGASVDLVVCAQAFHWFDAPRALAEFARILRPGGRVALVWNDRDEADALTRGYTELIREASQRDAAMECHTRPEPLMGSTLFRGQRAMECPNEQALDAAGLVGRALSASYVPKEGARHEAVVAGLLRLHARAADDRGLVRLRYRTRVFLAERA